MIPVTHRKGQRLYVFGLGHTGLSAVAALLAGGARVLAWDDREAPRDAAAVAGAMLVPASEVEFAEVDAVVLSPGIPLTHPEPHPVVVAANEAGVPVIGDTELFVREAIQGNANATLIAITGTNGKSTTTALIGHLLAAAGQSVEVGGNIGSRAVLELSPALNPTRYVIEFSSYQLDLTPSLMPDVAVFLNLSPDHLERHGGMEGYAAAKRRIFSGQGAGNTLVLGQDDPMTAAMVASVPPGVRIIPISQDTPQSAGVWGKPGRLFDEIETPLRQVYDLEGNPSLRGAHNRQNAAAAVAALRSLGLERSQLQAGLASFPGLAHRMERVGDAGRVIFVNDSKATNAEAAEKSLNSYSDIHWIAGGLAKAGGLEPLIPCFSRVARAYLIGEAASEFAVTLSAAGLDHVVCGTLDRAVELAARDAAASAAPEPCVLLAPACASFDQFPNFEARGDAFRDAVAAFIADSPPDKGSAS